MSNRYGYYGLRILTGAVVAVVLMGGQCEDAQKRTSAPAESAQGSANPAMPKEQAPPKEISKPAPKKQEPPAEKPIPLPAPFAGQRDKNLDKWRDNLGAGDRDFRSFAAISLLRSGDKGTMKMLLDMLVSAPDDIRLTIIKAFQFDANEAALEELIGLLGDPNGDVRHAAIEALGEMRSAEAVTRMAAVLADNTKPSAMRVGVAEALGRTKEKDAIGALVAALQENDEVLRKTAGDGLIGITRLKDLGHDPAKWREWWDRNKTKSREQILEMVLHIVEIQAEAAQRAFEGVSGLLAEATIDKLRNRPDKNDPTELIKETNNLTPKVRIYVAEELAKIKADTAFKALTKMLSDKSEEVRAAVVRALGEAGDKRAVDDLIRLMKKDADPLVQAEAAASLRKLPTPWPMDPLLEALESPNVDLSVNAANALGELRDTRAVAVLMKVVSDPKRPARTREAAAGALGSLGDRRAVQPLIVALTDSNDRLRWYAAMALGKLGNGEAVKPLCQVVVSDGTPNVREAAAMSLGVLRNKEAMDALSKSVNDQDTNVANAAREALFSIAGDDCDTLFQVGQILFAKPEYAAAIRIFEKLIEKYAEKQEYADEVWRARESLAQCYSKTGEWKKARPLYEELVKRDQSRAEVRQGLVKAMIQDKEYTVAAKFYVESLSQAPDQAAVWWSDLYKLLDEHFSEIGRADVALAIEDAEKSDASLGGDALKQKFLRLKARAQETK